MKIWLQNVGILILIVISAKLVYQIENKNSKNLKIKQKKVIIILINLTNITHKNIHFRKPTLNRGH